MPFRKMLLFILLLSVVPLSVNAAPITFTGVSATGTYVNDLGLLTDDVFPGEGTAWNSASTVSFSQYYETSEREYFTFDMGSLYLIDDISISVDNNDSYTIEYSTDQSSWLNLTTVDWTYGEIYGGMDTMTSISGDSEYISGLDFAQSGPAQYLRIYVDAWQLRDSSDRVIYSGPDYDGDGAYALGEFQAFGEAVASSNTPVPEPSTMLLLGAGLGGLALYQRKAKK